MRLRKHKVDSVVLHLVNQQKVASDVALTGVGPFVFQLVTQPLGAEGHVIGG